MRMTRFRAWFHRIEPQVREMLTFSLVMKRMMNTKRASKKKNFESAILRFAVKCRVWKCDSTRRRA